MYRMRLLRRGAYRHDEDRAVHEGLWPERPPHPFTGDLEHELADTWGEALRDTWRYAALEASRLPGRHTARESFFGVAVRPPAKFAYRLSVEAGWRDGWRGIAHLALAALSDVLVEARIALRRGTGGEPAGGHFADQVPAVGPVKVVGIARGAAAAEEACRWLAGAAAAGADVALISDAQGRREDVRVRRLRRWGPLHLVRSLDAEQQLRPADAVVPFGRRAARAVRLLPRGLLGRHSVPSAPGDAGGAVATIAARTRP
jgi:hypothetical protein